MSLSLITTGILGGSLGAATDGVLYGGDGINVESLNISEAPDDGGVEVVATGIFPRGEAIIVSISDGAGLERLCYAGLGRGSEALSDDGYTLVFVLPPMPIGGPYTLTFSPVGSTPAVVFDGVIYVHRSFTSNLFSLRSAAAKPRNVGAYAISEED